MELTRTPGSICRRRPWTTLTGLRVDTAISKKLFVYRVNVADDKAVSRAINSMRPLIQARPLNMQLNAITPNHGVVWCARLVLKAQSEPKTTVEVHGFHYVGRRQDGMNALQDCFHAIARRCGCRPKAP